MAAKKTNYIAYELKKLEKYFKQLQEYLNNNPPDKAEDRIEMMESTRGNPIIKVIQTKENQIKLFKETLKEMPGILEGINRLRKAVDGEEEDKEVRGGHGVPGFMRNSKAGTYKKREVVDIEEDFDDDDLPKQDQLSLPGPIESDKIKEVEAEDEKTEEEWEEEDQEDAWDDED